MEQSLRSKIVTRRTYNRPIDEEKNIFETWEQTVDRVISHQKWLWERAKKESLTFGELEELEELRELLIDRKCAMSGRTTWLGGTEVARKREASQFNCSFTKVETIYDVVDVLWLLMQGCGVGFTPVVGQLSGFNNKVELDVIRSTRSAKGGNPDNVEFIEDGVWTIRVGDSAEAWAKSIGKLLGGKHTVSRLVLDFSELRPAGQRLSGYGWISSGDSQIAEAFTKIVGILNARSSSLLSRIDILDVVNLLGTILSSRRSAEIALFEVNQPEIEDFRVAKYQGMWEDGLGHREQSNNTELWRTKPTIEEFYAFFDRMIANGGSEPALLNGAEALRRAPWFSGINPCAEILLANKGFCNLVEINVAAFDSLDDLHHAILIMARANYRQTCVNLQDGILQEAWHKNNEFLRLCGVGLTGIAMRPDLIGLIYAHLRETAHKAANGMADELGLQRPKNVTTIKPSGTMSKVMDCTEGCHDPIGEFILNNINMSSHDPLVPLLRDAGYRVAYNPTDQSNVLVSLPVSFKGIGRINPTAVEQLERYIMLQRHWTDQNTSITVTYTVDEVDDIVAFFDKNWDDIVGVSFILKDDKTYAYYPQEVITEDEYNEYVSQLQDVDIDAGNSMDELEGEECSTGACPIR